MPTKKLDCSKGVWDGWRQYSCRRAATVTRNGKPFCTQHDPDRIAKKREERKKQWDADWEAEEKQRQLEDVAPELLKGLRWALKYVRMPDGIEIDPEAFAKEFNAATAAVKKAGK